MAESRSMANYFNFINDHMIVMLFSIDININTVSSMVMRITSPDGQRSTSQPTERSSP